MFNKMAQEKNENEKTTVIEASSDISAPLERVWATVSDVDSEPKYYSGLNSVRNIRKDGNTVEREVTVGFRGQSSRQRVEIDNQNKSIIVTNLDGHIRGKRTVVLTPGDNGATKVSISWALDLSDIPFIGRSIVRKNLEKSTDDALKRLSEELGT